MHVQPWMCSVTHLFRWQMYQDLYHRLSCWRLSALFNQPASSNHFKCPSPLLIDSIRLPLLEIWRPSPAPADAPIGWKPNSCRLSSIDARLVAYAGAVFLPNRDRAPLIRFACPLAEELGRIRQLTARPSCADWPQHSIQKGRIYLILWFRIDKTSNPL